MRTPNEISEFYQQPDHIEPDIPTAYYLGWKTLWDFRHVPSPKEQGDLIGAPRLW